MKKILKTLTVAVALAVAAAVPAFAGEGEGCVDVELTIDPPTACAGDTIVLTTSVNNCGDRKDKVRMEIVLEGPEGLGALLNATMKVRKATEKSKSIPFELPPNNVFPAPVGVSLGTFVVTVNAESKKGGTDSASATVEIIACPA